MKVLYSGSRDELNAKLQERDEAIERLSKDCERLAENSNRLASILRQAILADDNLSRAARDDAMEDFLIAARTALQLHKGE